MERGIRLTEKILTAIINDKKAAGTLDGAEVAQDALNAVRLLQKAFDKACEEAADSTCPGEHDLCNFDECNSCAHYSEIHEDTERDINCWKKYYLWKATTEDK